MSGVGEQVHEALGADLCVDVETVWPPVGADICGYDLGTPVAWVCPRTTEDVQTIVRLARGLGTPLVPVGRRSAYWRPLRYEGAIALDTSRLCALGAVTGMHEPLWVGAGATVRSVDEHLRVAGQVLPCHPDAFGDTSIGAMVATGFAAGCGVGTTSLEGLVAGLVVVLGTGEVLRTGAANTLGHAPFMRIGLPDPTALFFGSDGALGVVTEVAVRPWPAQCLAQLSIQLPGDRETTRRILDVGRGLRTTGCYETLRAVLVREPGQEIATGQLLDVVVRTPGDEDDLNRRVSMVRAALESSFPGRTAEETREVPGSQDRIPRWRGEEGGAWEMLQGLQMAGIDVNLPYGGAETCLDIGDALFRQAEELPSWVSMRRGLYMAPEHLNMGYHLVFDRAPDEPREDVQEALAQALQAFAEEAVVPYRWGRMWGEHLWGRLDPGYLGAIAGFKAQLDPDGILHPGAALWE